MPNGTTCQHHTTLAVKVGQQDTRLNSLATSVSAIEISVAAIQKTMWRWGGAVAVLVFLMSIFGSRIAGAIFKATP
jgi:hypothetical protein